MSDDTLEAVLTSIDSNVVEKNDVAKAMLGGVTARKNTAEGMKFTDFSVMQPDGKEAKLSDYVGNGKYVLVDFWASWCRHCKHEIPNVKAVYDKYHGKISTCSAWPFGRKLRRRASIRLRLMV